MEDPKNDIDEKFDPPQKTKTSNLPCQDFIKKKRNVIVIGRAGGGKSTVSNKIIGSAAFEVKRSLDSVTRNISDSEVERTVGGTKYNIKVIDTIGLFDHKISNIEILEQVKLHLRTKVPEGLSLVIFVFREGRMSPEEQATFDYILENFREEISAISALVITGCETYSKEERQAIVKEFKTNRYTAGIYQFMKKGVHCVGFPPVANEKARKIYEEDMKEDENHIKDLVANCDELKLYNELFDDDSTFGFWSKCTIL